MIEAAWPWLRYQPGSALSRWFQEPLRRSNHFDSARGQAECRAAGRFSRTIALRLSRYGSRRPSQICHPAEKRRTMSRRSIPPHRCAASSFQLIFDRVFHHQLLGVSLPRLGGVGPRPIPATRGRVTAASVTGALPSSSFEFQLPHRDRSFTKECLRPAAVLAQYEGRRAITNKRRASVTSIQQPPRKLSAPVPHRNRWSRRSCRWRRGPRAGRDVRATPRECL